MESDEQKAFEAVLADFAGKTHATVTYTSGGNNVTVLLNSRLAGGAPPDVALIPQPGVVAQFVQEPDQTAAGQCHHRRQEQLLGRVAAVRHRERSAVRRLLQGRQQVGDLVPHRRLRPRGRAATDQLGRLHQVSQTISDSGVTPMSIPAGDGWPLTDWFENIYLRVAGADKYDQLAAHQLPWTDPTVVRSLTLFGDYLKHANFVESGATQLSFTQSVADVFGTKPKAAMLYEGDFVAGEITKSGKAKVGTDAKFFDFPSINGSPQGVVTGGDEAVVFKDSPASQALMAYLASPRPPRSGRPGAGSSRRTRAGRRRPTPTTPPGNSGEALARSASGSTCPTRRRRRSVAGRSRRVDHPPRLPQQPERPGRSAAKLEAAAVKDYGSSDDTASRSAHAGSRQRCQAPTAPPVPRPAGRAGRRSRMRPAAPAGRGPSVAGPRAHRAGFPAARPSSCSPSWWLPDPVHRLVAACTARTAASFVGLDNYVDHVHRPTRPARRSRNNIDLGRGGAGRGHRARPDLRGADRAGPLGHRVQADPVHADGDLRSWPPGVTFRLVYDAEPGPGRRSTRSWSACTTSSRRRRRTPGVASARRQRAQAAAGGGRPPPSDRRGPGTAARCRWSGCPPDKLPGRRATGQAAAPPGRGPAGRGVARLHPGRRRASAASSTRPRRACPG